MIFMEENQVALHTTLFIGKKERRVSQKCIKLFQVYLTSQNGLEDWNINMSSLARKGWRVANTDAKIYVA